MPSALSWLEGSGLPRTTARHAAAAYLASTAGSRKLCSQVDPAFCFDLEDACTAPSRAAAALNAELPDGQKLTTRDVLRSQQKKLSQALDSTSFEELLSASSLAERATTVAAWATTVAVAVVHHRHPPHHIEHCHLQELNSYMPNVFMTEMSQTLPNQIK